MLRRAPLLFLLLFAATAVPVAEEASAGDVGPQEFAIGMGAVDPAIREAHEDAGQPLPPPGAVSRTDRFEYLTYYPQQLQVHRGDRVRFLHEGFHTATFVESLDDQPAFLRRDEVQDVVAVDAARVASDASCVEHAVDVSPGTPACVLEDTPLGWNTGWNSALVEVDLPVGRYLYVCGIHDMMHGWIEVVPEQQEVPSPQQVEAERQRRVVEDTANAAGIIDQGQTPDVQVDGDRRVWTVKMGDFTPDGRVAIIRFLPGNLTVGPEDAVRFVVPDGPGHEAHTASFPRDAYPLQIAHYLTGACDPDDPRAGLPGVPMTLAVLVLGCPEPLTTEIHLLPHAYRTPTRAPGNLIATPQTLHDSGWLTTPTWSRCLHACDPWTGQRWPSEHEVTFGTPGSYPYACNIHPERGMLASITVSEP